jgi:hypothetical protein
VLFEGEPDVNVTVSPSQIVVLPPDDIPGAGGVGFTVTTVVDELTAQLEPAFIVTL